MKSKSLSSFLYAGMVVLAAVLIRADTTVSNVTVNSGQTKDVIHAGTIETSGNVIIQPGADVVFWSKTKIQLMPGFHAVEGSFFQAAVDSNLDGYSDADELKDSDGDGIFDQWEIDHGMNPFDASDAAADFDHDGMSNLQEFLAGRDIWSRENINFDSANSGMSDAWQMRYFHHLGVDPNGDADGDGITNRQEYQHGTDPLHADAPTVGLVMFSPAR